MNQIFPGFEGPKISPDRRLQWVENVFFKQHSVHEIGHDYIAPHTKRSFARAVTIVLIIIFGMLMARALYLQAVQGAYYASLAEGNRVRHVRIPAPRGIITDRFGMTLTNNIPTYTLHGIPRDIPRDVEARAQLSAAIASTLELPLGEVSAKIDEALISRDREVVLYDYLTQQQAIAMAVHGSNLPALQVVTGVTRDYVDSEGKRLISLSHVLGYEGKISESEWKDHVGEGYTRTDNYGKIAIERAYESSLRGSAGEKLLEVNARGVPLSTISETAPKEGARVVLTIDAELQRVAEISLQTILTKFNKTGGAVVVEDPRNGEIKTLVSLPAFDNNSFAQGISVTEYNALLKNTATPLLNRATLGQYPSGSVVKPVVAVAALAENVIDETTTVRSTGGIQLGTRFFPDWKPGGHGVVDVKQAIAQSVNTFFYMVGGGYNTVDGLGATRLTDWLMKFGFGEKRGLLGMSEGTGFVPTPAWKEERKQTAWFTGDTYNVSIGQGDFLVTPLQMSGAISAIINDGVSFVPHVVKEIIHEENTETMKPVVARRVEARHEIFQTVREGMRQTIIGEKGSARSLQTLPISIAGKTGTAQAGGGKLPHAWFIGYAPYEAPEIVVTVLVEEGEEGSRLAVPIAREIFDWYAAHRLNQ